MNASATAGSNAPRHVRKNTGTSGIFAAAMAPDPTEPTMTTKALLVSVTAPRMFATANAKTGAELELETVATGISMDDPLVTSERNDGKEISAAEIAVKINSVPSAESAGTERTSAKNENASTSRAATDKIQSKSKSIPPKLAEQTSPSKATAEKLAEKPSDQPLKQARPRAMSEDVRTVATATEKEDGISREEAAAVVKVGGDDDDPDGVEAYINVEELLRIAFQNLLEEYHLLNLPTYTLVLDKQIPVGSDGQTQISSATTQESTSWIQVQVMARPASLGIILERLERIGIGTNVGTLSIFKSELCRTASAYAHRPVIVIPPPSTSDFADSQTDSLAGASNDGDPPPTNNADRDLPDNSGNEETEDEKAAAAAEAEKAAEKDRILAERAIADARAEWKNAATRLRIEQVREQIVEQASMTFDYISLLIVASILAGIGLITDNTVVIVASMLVSPIMGPVLGCVFGLRVKDWPLVRMSFLNESVSLLICVFIGACVGLGASFTPLAEQTWPTNEMSIRGEPTGLLTGIAVAIPSGMGVCLSILGGNTSSLVGVAISASLLPPAVNAGVCFVYAIFLKSDLLESDSNKSADEFATIGAISFALTVLNIVCIWLSGAVMFEIKEVAPAEQKNAFWARDLKVARELNKDKQPKPVNVKLLRQGVGRALAKREKSDRNIPTVKIRPPSNKNRPCRTPDATVNSLFPLAPHGRPNQYPVWSTAWNDTVHGVEEDEDVRYVGLEDMGRLLGFDDDDEDESVLSMDHEAMSDRMGWGRYL